jgi:hypothetical protein
MTDEAGESSDGPVSARVRVDWRTGQPAVQHDESFWREHERRRLEQGLSVPQYCVANALALSTYRRRVSGRKRSSAKPAAVPAALAQTPSFVAVTTPRRATAADDVEIVLQGMTLRLRGEAAERVLARVMAHLS